MACSKATGRTARVGEDANTIPSRPREKKPWQPARQSGKHLSPICKKPCSYQQAARSQSMTEEYIQSLRKQLKGFPIHEQDALIDEIRSHIESGEEDPKLGKDVA